MYGVTPLDGRVARVLSDAEIEQVHAGSLHLLERVGMVFEDEAARHLLRAHGATVTDGCVRLPSALVEEALALCPQQFTLPARNPTRNVELGRGKVFFTSGYGATFVQDLATSALRPATLADARQVAVLADALDMVHYCLLSVIPQDLPGEKGELAGAAILLATTDKHVGPSLSTVTLYPVLIELARLAAGDGREPAISLGCTVTSPLRLSSDSIARLRLCARHRIPFRIVSAPMAGVTSPATLAGTLVLQNAEVLGGLTLGQLMNPGTPLMYGTFAAAADMRSGKIALGGPELALLNAASAQMCRRYGVPLGYGTGGTCDSPLPDVQAGAERMMTALFAASAGVEVIHDAVGGLLGSAMGFSAAQMVLDNELCLAIERLLQGIGVSPETLALDLIGAVGPGGNYLAEEHTLRHFRREHFLPRLMNRASLSDGPSEGLGQPMLERARAQAERLLLSHKPAVVEPAVRAAMESLLRSVGVDVSLPGEAMPVQGQGP